MPETPFAVSGIVYDVDGSTALEGVKVGAYNQTNAEWLPSSAQSTTNSNGEYTIDLANFNSGWSSGDIIYVYAKIEGKNAVMRAIIGGGDSSWGDDLYLKEGELVAHSTITEMSKVASVCASTGSDQSISIIEIESGRTPILLNVSANETKTYTAGKPDIKLRQGYWVLITGQGTNANNQSSGVSSSIGDTSSNETNIITVNSV